MLTRALRVCLDDIIRNFRIRGNSNDSIEFISFLNVFVWIAIKKNSLLKFWDTFINY